MSRGADIVVDVQGLPEVRAKIAEMQRAVDAVLVARRRERRMIVFGCALLIAVSLFRIAGALS